MDFHFQIETNEVDIDKVAAAIGNVDTKGEIHKTYEKDLAEDKNIINDHPVQIEVK